MNGFKLILGALVLTLLASCLKPPNYSFVPEIQFDSISNTSVNQLIDSVTVVISFTDGDGDLGALNTFPFDTITNLFFKDSRTGSVYRFQFPYITPIGSVKDISGEIAYTFAGITCRPNRTNDTLHYTVQIADRAGNLSNEIITPDIYVNCR